MKRKVSWKKSAFTITELVIVMIVLSIFSMGVYAFFANSVRLQSKQSDEYKFQADMRDSMLTIETKVKKSKSIFAIPQNEFLASDGKPFDRLWTYIGVVQSGPNAGHVCMFECENPESSSPPIWKETVLTSGDRDIKYELSFKKSGDSGISQKKLDYSLTGKSTYGIERSLTSSTEVLTAAAVVDRGTDTNPSTVIAIRNGKVKPAITPSLTFVVDVSGSMKFRMKGRNDRDPKSPVRMEECRKALISMVESLHEEGFPVDVCVVDFNAYADILSFKGKNKWDYANLSKDFDEVVENINNLSPDRIKGRPGSTNIGDGLRIGCESIKRNRALNPTVDKSRFLVLLTDGSPTTATSHVMPDSSSDYNFEYDGTKYKYYEGTELVAGTALKSPDGYNFNQLYLDYATMMGKKYRPGNAKATPKISPGSDPIQGLKPYIISVGVFTPAEEGYFRSINSSLGNAPSSYYTASNERHLRDAISIITADFLTDAWTYAGPRVVK